MSEWCYFRSSSFLLDVQKWCLDVYVRTAVEENPFPVYIDEFVFVMVQVEYRQFLFSLGYLVACPIHRSSDVPQIMFLRSCFSNGAHLTRSLVRLMSCKNNSSGSNQCIRAICNFHLVFSCFSAPWPLHLLVPLSTYFFVSWVSTVSFPPALGASVGQSKESTLQSLYVL